VQAAGGGRGEPDAGNGCGHDSFDDRR
jgi:hypothetical protein